MKRKNLISGLLAGALVLTSAVVPGARTVNAEETDLTDGLVASYSFDNDDLTDGQGGADAEAVVTGLGSYSGRLNYVDGQSGRGLQLNDYGLKLNRENLGENFTVSLWLKPDGTLAADQSVLFMGYHSPEKWLAVAGDANNTNRCRFWANGNGYGWTGLGTTDINSGSWHQLTITGSDSGVTAYLDGVQWGAGDTNSPLAGDNQDIYVGVTFWDTEFTGAVDEVKVYDRTLSAAEAYRLYDADTSAEDLLTETGVTVTDTMNMIAGRTQKIEVSLHAVVEAAGPAVTFESSDPSVAEVSDDGTVTAVGSGTAEITTTVSLNGTVVTGTTAVTVTGSLDETLTASYDFEDSLVNGADTEESADALVTGLGAYTGDAVYEEGRTGQAVRLGDYGLKLNQENLGTEYTVSMWVKSDGTLAENQCVLFMGYHDPEKWIAISGRQTGTNRVKFWANGSGYSWTTLTNATIPAGDWHQITVTGTEGQTTLYMDGISLGTTGSNDPLNGTSQDIYIGVNNWDTEFEGLVDDVKVYSIAMTAEEVQNQARDEFQAAFQEKVDTSLVMSSLLGDNKSAEQVVYNLELPDTLDNMSITWSSSNPDVIADDGTVVSPGQDTQVTMTAAVANGTLTASKEFTFNVPALDRTGLDALIAEAGEIDTTYLTDLSRTRLEEAIASAESADSYTEVEEAAAELRLAMDNLYYREEAVNPFRYIADPETQITMKAGEEMAIFSIPAEISDLVTVTYTSENEDVAVYADGTVTAALPGKTIVTAVVTAKYDGFSMEYSTAVEVKEASVTPALPFGDVNESDWYYDAVSYIYQNGLMIGLNDTTFGPAQPLARAQFAVILYRMSGAPEVEYRDIFPDVPADQWYTDAILWANENGIVTGYGATGMFGTVDNISREQMAVMMYRYAAFRGLDTGNAADISGYQDAENVSDFAEEAMQWAVGNGIISGKYNETVLDPQGNASRAECATILMRFMELYKL